MSSQSPGQSSSPAGGYDESARPQRLVVYTDLDGTLLDHHTYSYEAARPALDALAEREVPVVFVTSKTKPEVMALRAELGNAHPFAVENGAAVCVPAGYFPGAPRGARQEGAYSIYEVGVRRERLVGVLAELREASGYKFCGFSDMTAEQLAQRTSLPLSRAAAANQRLASEPVVWEDTPERYKSWVAEIEGLGLRVLRGGRFVHVMGQANKGTAVRWLNRQYGIMAAVAGEDAPLSVALGDSGHDVPMLEAVRTPVVVRGPHAHPPELPPGRDAIVTRDFGPEGWCAAIFQILEEIDSGHPKRFSARSTPALVPA